MEICRKRGMLLCVSLCTDSLDHGGYDGDAADHVCCVPWAISQGLRLRDAGRDSLVYNKGQRIFIRHEPNPCHEKICHHICGHAALYSNRPGGLAFYQGRHADAGRIALPRRIPFPSGNDSRVYLCSADDDGLQGSGRAFYRFCYPRDRESQSPDLSCPDKMRDCRLDGDVDCGCFLYF